MARIAHSAFAMLRFALIISVTACTTNAAPGLGAIDDLQLIVDAGGHTGVVTLATMHDGAPCMEVDSSLGGTYGGLPLVRSTVAPDCNFMRALNATVDAPITSSVVAVHDDTRSITATYPADILIERTMSLSAQSGSAGETIQLSWLPETDLVQGVTPVVTFRLPVNPPGCMEGCPPSPFWQTTAQVTATGLSFTIPSPNPAVGTGTLTIAFPPVSGMALSCDLADCRYNLFRATGQTFTGR